MPFPFMPGGALLAIAVLGGALTVFGVVLRTMDRAIAASRHSVLPGLVSGFRGWTASQAVSAETRTSTPTAGSPAAIEIIELVDRRMPDDDHGA